MIEAVIARAAPIRPYAYPAPGGQCRPLPALACHAETSRRVRGSLGVSAGPHGKWALNILLTSRVEETVCTRCDAFLLDRESSERLLRRCDA